VTRRNYLNKWLYSCQSAQTSHIASETIEATSDIQSLTFANPSGSFNIPLLSAISLSPNNQQTHNYLLSNIRLKYV
jgi:hypothetical protein